MELSDRSIGWRVKPAARSDHRPLLFGLAEILAGDSVSIEISRAEHACGFGEFRDSGNRLSSAHDPILQYVGAYR